jgi:hypothetical protein
MSRSGSRLAAALLMAAALSLTLASPSWGLAAPQPSWSSLAGIWSWLTGARPDAGCWSDLNGIQCPPDRSAEQRRPAHPSRHSSAQPRGRGTTAGRHPRTDSGCSIDPNGHCIN